MRRFLVVIVLLWSAKVQAATDRDLLAAYCLGVVRAAIAAPLPYVGGLPPSAEAEAVEINRRVAARMREAEQHLSRYLLARDPGDAEISFALKSGENDQKTMTERPVDNHCSRLRDVLKLMSRVSLLVGWRIHYTRSCRSAVMLENCCHFDA